MLNLSRTSPAHMPRSLPLSVIAFCAVVFANVPILAQSNNDVQPQIRYDEATHMFRMEAADVSYIFGTNQRGELQTLYWGKRLRPTDLIPEVRADGGSSAFDLPVNATPQEFTSWGGGLVVVPDLKITFSDGDRDLVLHHGAPGQTWCF